MAIVTRCPTCGKEYKFAESLAGRTLRCDQCAGQLQVPGVGGAGGRQSAPAPLAYDLPREVGIEPLPTAPQSDTPRSHVPPAPNRTVRPAANPSGGRRPALNALILSIITFLGATCLSGMGGLMFYVLGHARPGAVLRFGTAEAAIFAAGGVVMIAVSIIYFIASFKIRRGSRRAAMATLIAAIVHELMMIGWMCYSTTNAIMGMKQGGMVPAPALALMGAVLLVQLAFVASVGLMMRDLLKIVRS